MCTTERLAPQGRIPQLVELGTFPNQYPSLARHGIAAARQSKDESLYKMSVRIRARAIQRAGELLKEIKRERTPEGTWASSGRASAEEAAGLSSHQRKSALRVANVPSDQFERAVESNNPPSIGRFAERGTLSTGRLAANRHLR